ncbi:hypothetical protein OC846_006176 [Tilletia horrida]|uniref:WW domain-containing protein n=1 Tax=Tilletia horrida TaxID=155126 RepID=A0AAN6JPK2_9BASI|nr:hypothetical protein OC846_006176 [Tilletia horrida]KAK0544567.1 hypothetical protein OC845_005516 [Tilletia horrida]KAK0559375.1 hypothetical protein OC861_006667 [Tilletia horrida]
MRAGKEKAEESSTSSAPVDTQAPVKLEDSAQDDTAPPATDGNDQKVADEQEASSSSSSSTSSNTKSAKEDAATAGTAMTGTDPATQGWQAIWDDTRGQYYFWNEQTQTSTWDNPLQNSTDGQQQQQQQPAQRQPGEIDPELAFLDPSLALASATQGRAGPSTGGAALYASAAHFDPKSGRFLGSTSSSSALSDKHAAYGDPSRYFSSSQRAKRQMDVFFDSEAWEEEKAAKAAELDRKRRRIEQGELDSGELNDVDVDASGAAADGLDIGAGSKHRPTKKELQAFQAKKKQRKKAKLDWLRT